MTGKELFIAAITAGKPARPVVSVFSGGAWTYNRLGYTLEQILGQPELAARCIVETNRLVESDAVWTGSGFNNLPIQGLGGTLRFRAKGAPEAAVPLLATAADCDRFDAAALADDPQIRGLWETAALVDRAIGEETLVGGSGWGPFTLAAQMYGTERLMLGMYKDPGAVRAVLDFALEVSVRYYRGYIDRGARIISIGEPTASGDMISRRHFEEFFLPILARFTGQLRQSGAFNLLHICGNISDRLDLIPGSGVDLLSVDYKVELARVREVLGTRLAFAGNVNPVAVLEQGTPDRVAAAARDCLAAGGCEGNFVLLPGCDLAPGTPLDNVRTFIETGKTYAFNEN